jgi:hypothetical protein
MITMRLNDATPADWDRARKFNIDVKEGEKHESYPAIERANDKAGAIFNKWSDPAIEEAVTLAEEDVVNRPKHYNTGDIECIDAIRESMSSVAYKGYLKGNSLKYLWRYDYKGKQVEDLQKAQWYLNKLTGVVVEENE